MDNGKISVRYARTLLRYANEQHCETAVYEGLTRLTENMEGALTQFNEALSNPLVETDKKKKLLLAAIGDPVHPCLTDFLEFLTEKKRENKIFLIALKYQEMYRKEKNLLKAKVTTAAELDDTTLEKIRRFVETNFHCGVEMHVEADPTLIGGFVLDIENDRMDASIAGRLNLLKESRNGEPLNVDNSE